MKKILLCSFSMFLFVGFSYFLYNHIDAQQPHHDVDSKAYIEKAILFAEKGSFKQDGEFPYYTLGYPLMLGILYKVFGPGYFWVVIFQILLVLLSGILIRIIAQRLFNEFTGTIACVLMMLNLGYLVFAQFILTEIVLSFFLLLFLERFTAYLYTKKVRTLVSAGFLLGLSIVIKPAAIYFPVLLVPLMRFKLSLIFSVCFFIPVFVYMIHNKIIFNQFKISALDEVNIVYWWYPNALARQHGTTSDYERVKLQKIAHEHGKLVVRAAFKKDLCAQPLLFITVWCANVVKTFLGLYTSNLKVLIGKINNYDISFFRQKGTTWLQKFHSYIRGGTQYLWVVVVGYAEFLFQIVRYLLCILACILLYSCRRWKVLYFLSTYIFYFSMITGHDGCARFRMMFESVLIILMAYACVWLLYGSERKIFRKGEGHE